VVTRKGKTIERDMAEEVRLLYVAMTRPRDELYRLSPMDMYNIRTKDGTDRWARYFYQHWRRDGLELRGEDVLTEYPAGTVDFDADPVDLQHYLATAVRPGDAVELERLYPDPIGLLESPPYLIKHQGRLIGTASEKFRTDLYRFLKLGGNYIPRTFPVVISKVCIDTVETVAGNEAAGIRAGLNQHGVWLAPRLTGLSTFTWDKKELDVEAQ
jgi:hypothetical protein